MKGKIIEYNGKNQGHKSNLAVIYFPGACAMGMFGYDISGIYLPVPAFFKVSCENEGINKLCKDCSSYYGEIRRSEFEFSTEELKNLICTAKKYQEYHEQTMPNLVRMVSKIKF